MRVVYHQLHMNVSTNLDQLLKERFDAAIGAKVTQFKAELQLEVNRLWMLSKKKLQAQTDRYQTELSAKINEVQAYIVREQQLIAAQQRDLKAKIKAGQRPADQYGGPNSTRTTTTRPKSD